ncbi:helix-turn-helix domain-containing protein [Legionella dresdenensis]|uniref:Helix-turn-helix domain-containing protein n=1 Tax=Legionella dresdenensis TaxID=450200 RepID=A0ABV8CFH1_9GAMM
MSKGDITKKFSERLTQAMCERGYASRRARGGIDISSLASIAGCSYQMARKYALGQVLPEVSVIMKIANHLHCHPANLLFGDEPNKYKSSEIKSSDLIEIDKFILKYILNKSLMLLPFSYDTEDVVNFIIETVYDAAHLNVDRDTLYKIIDMMISSAMLLNKSEQDIKLCGN